MKKVFIIVFAMLLFSGLVACNQATTPAATTVVTTTANPEKTGVGYGIAHKAYVGVATVVELNGVITDLQLEEYYMPYTWAKVAGNTEAGQADVVVVPKTSGTPPVTTYSWYAKYIVIGDKQFTGELRTTPLVIDTVTYSNEYVQYSATGIPDLFVWLFNSEDNCEWYVEQLLAGKAYVAKDTFVVNTSLMTWNQGQGFTKSKTFYWTGTNYPLGWVGNMNAIIAAIEGHTFDPSAVLTRATNNPDTPANEAVWSIGDAVTGATVTDFATYYTCIARAYAKTQE
jgi:hypothetical protein